MIDTQPLTVESLYATSGLFRAAVAKWVADRRCPIELGDFLEENGLVAAADCARWCVEQPDRPVRLPYVQMGERDGSCGPFPTMGGESDEAFWMWIPVIGDIRHADHIPMDRISTAPPHKMIKIPSPKDAILLILANWKVRE